MYIVIISASLAVLLFFAIIKLVSRRYIRRKILKDFELELNNRLKEQIMFSTDQELIMLIGNRSRSDAESDLLEEKLNQIREAERIKMLKEENFGLKF